MQLAIYIIFTSLLISTESARISRRKQQQQDYSEYFGEEGSPSNTYEKRSTAANDDSSAKTPKVSRNDVADLGKQGFSQGAGLRQIAQGSADQANTAVMNQYAAAKQAAFVAKNTLAQAAAQASATAQAALAGKQIILQGIEQQFRDAKVALDGENQQLMQAQRAADASQQASQQAQHQVNVIQAALNAAQVTADHTNQAASEAAGELAAQRAMVGSAQQRLSQLAETLKGVRIDFEATQKAAQQAQSSAQQAQAAAAEAATAAAAAAPPPPPPVPATTAPPAKPSEGKANYEAENLNNDYYYY